MSDIEYAKFAKLSLQLLEQYRALDAVIDDSAAEIQDSVVTIGEHMNRIKATEAELLPLRNAIVADKVQIGGELQQITDQTIAIVQGLMPKLAQIEKATADAAKRLMPQVQESVRAVQMQRAYGGRSRSA